MARLASPRGIMEEDDDLEMIEETPAPVETAPDNDLEMIEEDDDELVPIEETPINTAEVDLGGGARFDVPDPDVTISPLDKSREQKYELNNEELSDSIKQTRRAAYGDSGSVTRQFLAGLLNPTSEVSGGAASLMTGDPTYMELMRSDDADVPFDVLSPSEKAAWITGSAIGYVFPGIAINTAVKGGMGLAISKTGLKEVAKTAESATSKFVTKNLAQKVPTEIGRKIVGKYSKKFIKNAPTLAIEGAVWEGLASGGDPKAMVAGAILFPVVGPAAELALPALAKATGRAVSGVTKEVSTPLFDKIITEASTRPQVVIERVQKATDNMAKKYVQSKGSVIDLAVDGTVPEAPTSVIPKDMLPDIWWRTKAVEIAHFESVTEAEALKKAVRLGKKEQNILKGIKKKKGQINKLEARIASRQKKLEEMGVVETERRVFERPKTMDDIKTSYDNKDVLVKQFGKKADNIMLVAGIEDEYVIAQTLKQSGINLNSANSIAKQLLTHKEKIIQKPIKTTVKKASNRAKKIADIKFLERELGKLETKKSRLDSFLVDTRTDPGYIKDAQKVLGDTFVRAKKIDKGMLTKGMVEDVSKSKDQLAQTLYNEKVTDMGINQPWNEHSFSRWLNWSERASKVDEKYGVGMSDTVYSYMGGSNAKGHISKRFQKLGWEKDLISLKESGADGRRVYDWMFHVARDPASGKIKWFDQIPSRGEKIPFKGPTTKALEPTAEQAATFSKISEVESGGWLDAGVAFKGLKPTEKQLKSLFKLREHWETMHEGIAATGQEIGKFHNYVPTRKRVHLGKGGKYFDKTNKPSKASLLRERKVQERVPEELSDLYQTDMYELFPGSMSDTINTMAYGNAIEKALVVDWRLRALGKSKLADSFMKYSERAMGKGSKGDTTEYMVRHTIDSNPEWAAYWAQAGKKKEGWDYVKSADFANDMISSAYSWMYHTFIGVNPLILTKQFMQPFYVGSAETDIRSMMKSYRSAYTGTMASEDKQFIAGIRDNLLPERIDFNGMNASTKQWLEMFNMVMNLPGKPGMAAFQKMDHQNRVISALARKYAFEKGLKNGKLNEVFEPLLPGERNLVAEAYSKGGVDKAKETFALIGAKRDNYFYGHADKADIFAEGIGKYIPFVTWGWNQWMRHIGHATQGNYGTIGKRFAYPYAGVMAMQYLMNERYFPQELPFGVGTVSSAVPQASMLGVMGPDISPFTLAGSITDGSFSSYGKAYKKLKKWGIIGEEEKPTITLGKTRRKGMKITKKKKTNALENTVILNLKSPFGSKKGKKKNEEVIIPGLSYTKYK